jgi:hypothetical protein
MESKSNELCTCCIVFDPPGYINPSEQDMLFTDLTDTELSSIAYRLEVQPLSIADPVQPPYFPVEGVIHGLNNRLMVNLVCKKSRHLGPKKEDSNKRSINVVFVINTGSPCTYLSAQTMKALGDDDQSSTKIMDVTIQSGKVIECRLSPPDKHYANVNVLGMNFLAKNSLSLAMNYRQKRFELAVKRR